jgi:hypothetical protein
MSIVYTITINGVRVTTEGDLSDVVKEIDYTLKGTDSGCSFELPIRLKMGAADPASFTPFSGLTEAQLVSWIEAQPDLLDSSKAHIAYVVAKEVERSASESKPLPWVPVPEPAPVAPPTAE